MKANAKADEARRREEVYAMSPESRFLHAVYATNEGSDDPRTRLLIPCNGLSYAKRKKLEQELQHERKMAMGDKVLRYLSTDDYAAWSDWVSTDEGRDACRSRLGRAIHDAEAAYRDQIRLELTAELLSSEFALGDGRRPTWGTASIEDHRARIAMQQGKAEAVIKDAARHGKAIEMLEGSGASCLNELAEQSEAA
jgi:hypothetical protein